MKKEIKITLIVLVIVIAGIVAWFVAKKKKNLKNSGDSSGSGSGGSIDTTPRRQGGVYVNECSFPLSKGSKGKQVLFLQAYMNEREGKTLSLDGIWGGKTDIAFEDIERFKVTNGPASSIEGEFSYSQYAAYINPVENDLASYIKSQTNIDV